MAAKTLTSTRPTSETSGSAAALHDISNTHHHHDTAKYTLPRTISAESVKAKLALKTKSSMDALVSNLQCIHLRPAASSPATKPSTPGVQPAPAPLSSQFDSDSDSEEEDASGSSSDDAADADADDATSYRTSPPYTRPCSPIGYRPSSASGFDSDDDADWDISQIKYTGGSDLAPCFARDPHAGARDYGNDERRASSSSSSSDGWSGHIPGTPELERSPVDWDALAASRGAQQQHAAMSFFETRSVFSVDDEDDGGDEVWPDEMDSDDFPVLHDWQHSWIWHPTTTSSANNVPSIHFHYVESLPPDQSAWTPLQDGKFGNCLTVPGHKAFNNGRSSSSSRLATVAASSLPPVRVLSLDEQAAMGVFSVPSRGRSVVKTPIATIVEDDEEAEEEEAFVYCGRGRSMRRSLAPTA